MSEQPGGVPNTAAPMPAQDGATPTDDTATRASLRLREPGGLDWQPVSMTLRTVRLIVLAVLVIPVLVIAVLLALTVHWAFWIPAGVVGLGALWAAWVISRQVSAISWVELTDDIVIRRGRIFRSMAVIPYGRLQYVDVESGPLARKFGLASVEIHTASPATAGTIPGLPLAVAEDLRERLSARGESQRAGL